MPKQAAPPPKTGNLLFPSSVSIQNLLTLFTQSKHLSQKQNKPKLYHFHLKFRLGSHYFSRNDTPFFFLLSSNKLDSLNSKNPDERKPQYPKTETPLFDTSSQKPLIQLRINKSSLLDSSFKKLIPEPLTIETQMTKTESPSSEANQTTEFQYKLHQNPLKIKTQMLKPPLLDKLPTQLSSTTEKHFLQSNFPTY